MSNLKSWSTTDIVQNASNWTLASDVGLLGYLESFSKDLLANAQVANENLNKLAQNLTNTNISLEIVKKEFSSLHNTQFIESRVYEDDYSDSASIQEQSLEEKNDDKLMDWKEAILSGINVVNKYYDKVQVPGSDSEDETDFPSYILRPKDQYAERRLPYIIGSEKWQKKWHVGLIDSSSESEGENTEKYNESEAEDFSTYNRINLIGDSESVSDISHNVTSKHPVANSTFEDLIDHSNLFGSNNGEENNNSVPSHAHDSTNNFADELAQKLRHVIEQNPKVFDAEVNRKPIQNSSSNKTIGNLFANEPPPLNEDDDLFGSNIQGGLFSGSSGLFDDIPEEDKTKTKDVLRNEGKNKVSKLSDLFSDDFDDLFSGASKNDKIGYASKSEPSQVKKTSNDLFDDMGLDDDEDDLFKDATPNLYKKSYLPTNNTNSVPFFDSEPPELVPPPASSVNDSKRMEKKPVGGIKIFGEVDVLGQHTIGNLKPTNHHSKKHLDSENNSTDRTIPIPKEPSDIFDDFHSGSINSQKIIEADKKEKFQQDSNTSKDIENEQNSNIPIKPHSKPINLFDDDDDIFEDDLFSNISTNKFTSDLFSTEIIGDDLFAQNDNKLFHEDLGFKSPKKAEQPIENNKNFVEVKNPDVQNIASTEKPIEGPPNVTVDKKASDLQDDRINNSSNANTSKNVLININLFDQNPPDLFDDGWDSKSDNLFDDNESLFDSTSVVTGHRSGLFDDEPPSLFSESSGIIRDMSATRVETDDSFNPFASSSRRFSTDIFSEQQSNDSFFITKNKSAIEHRTQSHLHKIPEYTDSFSNLDITPSGNIDDLFDDTTDVISEQKDNTDDLFSKSIFQSDSRGVENSKNNADDLFSSPKGNISKSVEDTDVLTTEIESKTKSKPILISEVTSTKSENTLDVSKDCLKEVVQTGIKNTIINDSAEEPLTSSRESVVDKDITKEDFASKIGSPGKLKHNLNINVNALKPGGGIISKKDMKRSNSTEDNITPEKYIDRSIEVIHKDAEFKEQDNKPSSTEESQILSCINKDRAKIPVKRRPSTRKARQEAIRNSIADFRINLAVETNTEETLPPKETAPSTLTVNVPENKSGNVLQSKEKTLDNNRRKSFSSSSLFDDPEEFDDLFSSKKLPPKSKILRHSLFDDDNDEDDDDIFGNSSGLNVKSKNPAPLKNEVKKPSKTTQLTKLENSADVQDPLGIFKE